MSFPPPPPAYTAGPAATVSSATAAGNNGVNAASSNGTVSSNGSTSAPAPSSNIPTSNNTNNNLPALGAPSFGGDLARPQTGLVYDVRMLSHKNIHERGEHPENPDRIKSIFASLKAAGLVSRCLRIQAREASDEELLAVHTNEHHLRIKRTETMSFEQLEAEARLYNSIYLCPESAYCGRLSCGGVIEMCNAVWAGVVRNGICVVRPPGHHAEDDKAMGFCLYNNVGVAAKYLQAKHNAQRIMIVDWDIHHGNGTQKMFYDDPNVFYVSIHRYDNGNFYPGSYAASHLCVGGEGEAKGKNLNVPWPCQGFGDEDYIYAFHKLIMPMAYEFDPDVVIISAGFDAAKGDHIGQCLVTPEGYAHMTYMLKSVADGRLIVALEGGYNLDSIASSMTACASVLLGAQPPRLKSVKPSPKCVETVQKVMEAHSKYWECLRPRYYHPKLDTTLKDQIAAGKEVVKLSEIVAKYTSTTLFEKFKVCNIPISNQYLKSKFRGTVSCSMKALHKKGLCYFFVHDSSEIRGFMQSKENFIKMGDSVMIDTASQYISKILSDENNAIFDVCVFEREIHKADRKLILEELMKYMWDNFLGISSASKIVIICSGTACNAVTTMLTERDVEDRVLCSVIVSNEQSPPMLRKKEKYLWYYDNSYVIMPSKHPRGTPIKLTRSAGKCYSAGVDGDKWSPPEVLHTFQSSIFEYVENKLTAHNNSAEEGSAGDSASEMEDIVASNGPVAAGLATASRPGDDEDEDVEGLGVDGEGHMILANGKRTTNDDEREVLLGHPGGKGLPAGALDGITASPLLADAMDDAPAPVSTSPKKMKMKRDLDEEDMGTNNSTGQHLAKKRSASDMNGGMDNMDVDDSRDDEDRNGSVDAQTEGASSQMGGSEAAGTYAPNQRRASPGATHPLRQEFTSNMESVGTFDGLSGSLTIDDAFRSQTVDVGFYDDGAATHPGSIAHTALTNSQGIFGSLGNVSVDSMERGNDDDDGASTSEQVGL